MCASERRRVHECSAQGYQKGAPDPTAGLTEGCELPNVGAGTRTVELQHSLLTAQPSLQPQNV